VPAAVTVLLLVQPPLPRLSLVLMALSRHIAAAILLVLMLTVLAQSMANSGGHVRSCMIYLACQWQVSSF
jgi:hypothetical protein